MTTKPKEKKWRPKPTSARLKPTIRGLLFSAKLRTPKQPASCKGQKALFLK